MKRKISTTFWFLGLVLCALVQLEVNAQNSTCDTATEQPIVTAVSPPAGTTSEEAGVSSIYTIQGERLDRVSRAELVLLSPLNLLNPDVPQGTYTLVLQRENSSAISFRIPRTTVERTGSLVNLVVYSTNPACQNITLQMRLHNTGKCMLHNYL